MLTSGDTALRAAISAAVRSRTPVPVVVDSLQFVCFRLPPEACCFWRAGCLRMMRPTSVSRISSPLVPGLPAPSMRASRSPNAVSAEGYRIVSFRRIPREAASRGSLRRGRRVHRGVERLGRCVRRAYVAGAPEGSSIRLLDVGACVLVLGSARRDHCASSRTDGPSVSHRRRTRRPARRSRRHVIARMAIGAGTGWVLVFSGMINDAVHVRLRVYTDILRESLNDVLTTITAGSWLNCPRRHAPQNEPVSTAAQTALGQLTTAVGARQAALVVTSTSGRQALASAMRISWRRSIERGGLVCWCGRRTRAAW